MRFNLGGIPDTEDFIPDIAWKPLREPDPWLMQLFALPLGLIAFFGVAALWFYATPLEAEQLESGGFLLLGLGAFIPLVVIHELIHAAVHPEFGRSNRSILGFWPSRLLFYAHYDGALDRNRFLAIIAMPMIVITFVPLLAAMATGCASEIIAWASVWNILFACGDIFGIILVLFQVPCGATVRNKGWRTYWTISNQPD